MHIPFGGHLRWFSDDHRKGVCQKVESLLLCRSGDLTFPEHFCVASNGHSLGTEL